MAVQLYQVPCKIIQRCSKAWRHLPHISNYAECRIHIFKHIKVTPTSYLDNAIPSTSPVRYLNPTTESVEEYNCRQTTSCKLGCTSKRCNSRYSPTREWKKVRINSWHENVKVNNSRKNTYLHIVIIAAHNTSGRTYAVKTVRVWLFSQLLSFCISSWYRYHIPVTTQP